MSASSLDLRRGKFANSQFNLPTDKINIYNKDRTSFPSRREGGYTSRGINDMMSPDKLKVHGNGITALNSAQLYQRFLLNLKKGILGASSNGPDLGDIVFTTPDGRSMLATEAEYVSHKLASSETSDSEQYKNWERLQATLEANAAHAEDEVGVLKIEYKAQMLADARAAAKIVEAVGETSPRPLQVPDMPRAASPAADGVDNTPPHPTRWRITRSVLQRITGSGRIEPPAEAADDAPGGTSDGDDADADVAGRGSAADTRASSPINTQDQLDAEELARDILDVRKKLLDARVKKIMGQRAVKEEETRLKSKLGAFNSFNEVATAQYRASCTLGWGLYTQYFDLATVQAILSLLCATDASGTAPYSLFQIVMEDWGTRCRRMDLRHCVPAMHAEQMLLPFVSGSMGIDKALATIQRLRANAAYVEWTPPAKALSTHWRLTPRNTETAASLDTAGALDIQEITWDHYSSFIDRMRQVPGDACKLTLNQGGFGRDRGRGEQAQGALPRNNPHQSWGTLNTPPKTHRQLTIGAAAQASAIAQASALAAQGKASPVGGCWSCGGKHFAQECSATAAVIARFKATLKPQGGNNSPAQGPLAVSADPLSSRSSTRARGQTGA
jgi:hypothetical protein